MAESTCLHIQDHDAGPIRIVEIPWISARIGRAAFCEVRLTDPSLPEEACRIQRRGRTWHLTPLHGSDVILDGRPIDGPRSLPYDASFQVGPFRLALRRGKFAEPDWRPSPEAYRPPPSRVEPTPMATVADPATPPLTNPWEARWRDAGDRLKAARAAEARPAPAPPPPPPATLPAPPPAPAVAERPAIRDIPRPAAAPRVEPAPRPRPAARPAAPKYEPRVYSRPTPSAPRPPAPVQKPPAPQAWTKPVPSPAPPVPRVAPPVVEAPKPVVEAPKPAPSPVAVPEPPVRRFHFLDPDLIARLESSEFVEAIQAVSEPLTIRRRLRRATVSRRAPGVDAPQPAPEAPPEPSTALALIHVPADEPAPASEQEGRGPDEESVPVDIAASFDCTEASAGDGEIETDRETLDAMTAEPAASWEQSPPAGDSIGLLSSSPLPPGEGSRGAAGEGRRSAEGILPAPTTEPQLSPQVRRPSPGPSGHPLPAEEGTSDAPSSLPFEAASIEGRREAEGIAPAPAAEPPPSPQVLRPSPGLSSHPLPAGEGTSNAPSPLPFEDASIVAPEAPSAWSYTTGPFVADTSGFGSGPVDSEPTRPRRAVARVAEEGPEGFDPTRSRRSSGEDAWVLPSVQDVLNNGLRRAQAEAGAIPRPASRPSLAAPTVAIEPSQWSPPAWLATPPALAATLAVGGLLAFCSWRQAKVSHDAAAVIQASASVRLAGAAAKDRPLPPGIVPPSPSWWGAAPAHLAEWGVYLDGTKVEHGWDATASGMFEAASAVGPLDPLAKLALARKRGEAIPAPGLSRDAVALAWTGRTLHKAGKDAEAVRAYRRALEVAAKAEPPRAAPLAYSEDPNVPRYLLPGEELAAAVVRELAGDASWSYRDWAEAVPETGVSALAAARALAKESRTDADAILKRIVERARADAKAMPDDPDVDPEDEAVALAVAAEAMAMRADWKGAAGSYRAAIDRMANPRVRRSWWFNLADVAMHSNDVDQRRAALDEALASADSDEVSRRVLELRPSRLSPKAN